MIDYKRLNRDDLVDLYFYLFMFNELNETEKMREETKRIFQSCITHKLIEHHLIDKKSKKYSYQVSALGKELMDYYDKLPSEELY